MFTTFSEIREALAHYRWFQDTVDIALVYYIFYRLLLIIKGTRAFQMLLGLGLIMLALIASQAFEFYTLDWDPQLLVPNRHRCGHPLPARDPSRPGPDGRTPLLPGPLPRRKF